MARRIAAYSLTDIGPSRKRNEDAILVDEETGVFVVADGMGGRAGGDVASRMAVEAVRDKLREQSATFEALAQKDTPKARRLACRAMDAAMQAACAAIFDGAQANPSLHGMGSTCDAVVLCGSLAIIGHVGDGRVQQLRDGLLSQLTEDHSWVARELRAGKITAEQAKTVPYRSMLTRALGTQEAEEMDTLVVECVPGDVLILSSDGLHGFLPAEIIAAALGRPDDGVAQRLLELAVHHNTNDNVSIVVLHFPAGEMSTAEKLTTVKITTLATVPLFSKLEFRELQAIIQIAHVESQPGGVELVREGEDGSDFYVILEGRASVRSQGKQLTDLEMGNFFGEMGLVEDAPRSATVKLLEPTTVLRFSRHDLHGLMRAEPALGMKLAWGMMQWLSERLRAVSANYARAAAQAPLSTRR